MTKWVIKKGDTGNLEVWQYIDTIEEASKYWYVTDAIEKYGVDDVLPIAMNSRGGYHSLKWDIENNNIVQIVESETKPILDLASAWTINAKNFKCGWVSPDCTTYSCSYMEHISLAHHICQVIYQKHDWSLSDDFLFNQGWIKVYNDGWTGDFEKINDNQIRLMENMGIKHHVYKDYDYNQLKGFIVDYVDWMSKNRE